MGFIDKFLNSMHLNDDDYYDDEDEYFDDEDDYEEEKPKRGLFGRKSSRFEDEDEDDYYDEPAPKANKKRVAEEKPVAVANNKVTPMRSTPRKGVSGMEVCVIKPASMDDAREITDTLLSNRTVVLNMEGLDMDIAQRIIDFASGSCYAMNGNLQKIANYIFIITPSSVDISGDFQNLLSGAIGGMPSITNNF